jgi:hypothetical protein
MLKISPTHCAAILGTRRVLGAFVWLYAFPVSAKSLCSHPKRLSPTVERWRKVIAFTVEKGEYLWTTKSWKN